MTIEETIAVVVGGQVAPVLAELRAVKTELEALRRAMPPQLVTMTAAAKALGQSLSTIRRKVKDGTLPCRRIGRSVRVDLSGLRGPTQAEVSAGVVALRDFRRHTSKVPKEARGGDT